MKSIARTSFVLAVSALVAFGQQPNSGYASMQINGSDAGVYPILTNVRTSLPAGFAFAGATNQPYVVYQTSGALVVGNTIIPATPLSNSVDIPLSPFPAKPIDGFINPFFTTDFTGTHGFSVQVPPAGPAPNGIPIGTQLSLQGALADPFSSIGVTLTAATRITVTQGPTVNFYTLGDENNQAITTTSMPIPFYGTNYTTLNVNANGYICLGTSDSDFTPSPAELLGGPPRIAPFWTDTDCPANSVKVTVDTPQGGIPGFVRVEWINVQSWLLAQTHTFTVHIQNDGYLELIHLPTNNPSLYDQLTGIAPGSNIGGAQLEKNFIGTQPIGTIGTPPYQVGPGILSTAPFTYAGGVNESFFEWFGILSQHAYYQSPSPSQPTYTHNYDNTYDLYAQTLHFLPNGSGALPGSTNRYTLY